MFERKLEEWPGVALKSRTYVFSVAVSGHEINESAASPRLQDFQMTYRFANSRKLNCISEVCKNPFGNHNNVT